MDRVSQRDFTQLERRVERLTQSHVKQTAGKHDAIARRISTIRAQSLD